MAKSMLGWVLIGMGLLDAATPLFLMCPRPSEAGDRAAVPALVGGGARMIAGRACRLAGML
jgi:hypothetical protein